MIIAPLSSYRRNWPFSTVIVDKINIMIKSILTCLSNKQMKCFYNPSNIFLFPVRVACRFTKVKFFSASFCFIFQHSLINFWAWVDSSFRPALYLCARSDPIRHLLIFELWLLRLCYKYPSGYKTYLHIFLIYLCKWITIKLLVEVISFLCSYRKFSKVLYKVPL